MARHGSLPPAADRSGAARARRHSPPRVARTRHHVLHRLRAGGRTGAERAPRRRSSRISLAASRLRRLVDPALPVRPGARPLRRRPARGVSQHGRALPCRRRRARGLPLGPCPQAGASGSCGLPRPRAVHREPRHLRALEYGHPEELLGGVLCVAAALAALGRRPVAAGLLLGLAVANKPWAVLAVVPVLLVLDRGHLRALAAAGAAAIAPVGPHGARGRRRRAGGEKRGDHHWTPVPALAGVVVRRRSQPGRGGQAGLPSAARMDGRDRAPVRDPASPAPLAGLRAPPARGTTGGRAPPCWPRPAARCLLGPWNITTTALRSPCASSAWEVVGGDKAGAPAGSAATLMTWLGSRSSPSYSPLTHWRLRTSLGACPSRSRSRGGARPSGQHARAAQRVAAALRRPAAAGPQGRAAS